MRTRSSALDGPAQETCWQHVPGTKVFGFGKVNVIAFLMKNTFDHFLGLINFKKCLIFHLSRDIKPIFIKIKLPRITRCIIFFYCAQIQNPF